MMMVTVVMMMTFGIEVAVHISRHTSFDCHPGHRHSYYHS